MPKVEKKWKREQIKSQEASVPRASPQRERVTLPENALEALAQPRLALRTDQEAHHAWRKDWGSALEFEAAMNALKWLWNQGVVHERSYALIEHRIDQKIPKEVREEEEE